MQITAQEPAAALPVVTPANGSKARYDAMARDYAANPTGNFTVQVQILCDPSNLGKAITAGGQNLWFVPQPIGGRSCYRVFWGRYATREEAQRALANVPASLRDPSAAVKPVPGRP
jgi:septal ring-binding cell division protein DamX